MGEKEVNLFADPKAEMGLSDVGRSYLAGLVATAPDLTALYSPFVNSYKRYVPGVWAPLTASWGVENRTCALRVINNSAKAARIELRQTAADLNPYVAMAASLGAGLYGIEHMLSLPAESKGDASQQGEVLPTSLSMATERLQMSDVARAILGEAFVDHYVKTRISEIHEYQKSVSSWELHRYFESV